MTTPNEQRIINENKRTYLEYPYPKEAKVTINTHNTFIHEILKSAIVYILKRQNKGVVSEAKWKLPHKGQADVYNLSDNIYIEVCVSETEEGLNKKIKKYPDIDNIVIPISEVLSEAEQKLLQILELKLREILI